MVTAAPVNLTGVRGELEVRAVEGGQPGRERPAQAEAVCCLV